MKIFRALSLFLFLLATGTSFAASLSDDQYYLFKPSDSVPGHPWAVLYYHSWMTDVNIGNLLLVDKLERRYGTMDTVELSYEIPRGNWLRDFLQPFMNTLEVAGNITHRNDTLGSIYEGDAYLIARWNRFPWNNFIKTSLAFGDGFSDVSSLPLREISDSSNHNAKRFLNFLMVETTFALPRYPQLEYVVRIHHRCGAWGFYGAGNLSSNAIGMGVRYRF